MMDELKKVAQIRINIGLDDNNNPAAIRWEADDQPDLFSNPACKAIFLSLFEEESKETLKIDLWTKEMQVMEMDRFLYFTLQGLAESYHRATNNSELTVDFQKFVQYFGQKTGIIQEK